MQHHRSRLKLQINHKKQQIAVIICSSEEPAAESHEQPHSNRKPVFSKKFRSLPYRSICQHDGIMWSRNHRTGRHRLSASHAPRKQERVLYFKHARAASFSRWPQNRSAPDPPPHALTSQHVTEHARTQWCSQFWMQGRFAVTRSSSQQEEHNSHSLHNPSLIASSAMETRHNRWNTGLYIIISIHSTCLNVCMMRKENQEKFVFKNKKNVRMVAKNKIK